MLISIRVEVAAGVEEGVNYAPQSTERVFLVDASCCDHYRAAQGGYGEKVSRELPKLKLRVQFPLPAPTLLVNYQTEVLPQSDFS